MSAPRYTGAAHQTLIYAADSSDPNFADLTTMGAAPLGSAARLTPGQCPAVGTSIDTTHNSLTTGKGGTGKAFVNTYLPQTVPPDSQQGPYLLLSNVGSHPIGNVHYTQAAIKHDASSLPLTNPWAIKFYKMFFQNVKYGAQQPQWGTHDHLPWTPGDGIYPKLADGTTDVRTFFEAFDGYSDGSNDGIQPVGPWWEDFLNDGQFHNWVWGKRCHQAALGSDGTTKLHVTLTGDGVNRTATAVFSDPSDAGATMAGKIANGQVIGLASTLGHAGAGYTVSAFDGANTCTLTNLFSAQDVFSATPYTTTFTLDFDGFHRLWIDGVLVGDVSMAAAGQTPTGARKAWCTVAAVQMLIVDQALGQGTTGFRMGSDLSTNSSQTVTQTINYGNGDLTNADTLGMWTETYSSGTADHLAITTEPSSSTVSGVAHAVQPAGTVEDASNATVTDDTSTVTATWVDEVGTSTPSGTTSISAVAGAWAFTDLAVTGAAGNAGHWDITDGSLTGVSTQTVTIAEDAPPIVAYMIYPLGA